MNEYTVVSDYGDHYGTIWEVINQYGEQVASFGTEEEAAAYLFELYTGVTYR